MEGTFNFRQTNVSGCLTKCPISQQLISVSEVFSSYSCKVITPGPELIKLFSCSTELSMKIFPLMIVKCKQLLAF